MVQVYIPAGEFVMGFSLGAVDESPTHTVRLDAFWLDQTEVTNAMFARFVEVTGYETEAEQVGSSIVHLRGEWGEVNSADWQHPTGPDSSIAGLENHPVVHVSWRDAGAYCEWAGRRLPTEAEWELSARGADEFRYPWGDQPVAGTLLNFADLTLNSHYSDTSVEDGFEHTAPVGYYPDGASPYGILDLAGNVWEWVWDFYDAGYYAGSPAENPAGPDEGEYHVLRGGSWNEPANEVRGANRHYVNNLSYNDVGFRCAASP